MDHNKPDIPVPDSPKTPRSNGRIYLAFCVLASLLIVKLFWRPPHENLGAHFTSNTLFRNRTDDVQFDRYSLILKGKRIFLHSGEFHTWRLPVPSLWPDILEKTKAAGLNAISIYTHMGLLNPSRGVVDFDGFRALKPLYEAAMAAGIWVVVRPGPYINAETSAGGIAHWATAEVAGRLRTNDSDWTEAWRDYIQAIIKETAPYQINVGGPVIGRSSSTTSTHRTTQGHGEYYEELKAVFHDSDIVVPLTYNDPNQGENFINGTVCSRPLFFVNATTSVDAVSGVRSIFMGVPMMDSYPQRFDCSHPDVWRPVVTNYHEYHSRVNPSQPWYIPEFQAGSYDAWGPGAPGYGPCAELTGPAFQSVFNLQLWASNAKLINYYMLYGGTSWGGLPFPGVYTSYDYGAPISESRALTAKYDELKLQGLFLRSTPDFAKTNWIGDSRDPILSDAASNPDVFVTLLGNPDWYGAFYIVRQNDSTSTASVDFKLTVKTLDGTLQIPLIASAITLDGRESKVIVAFHRFGASSRLTYSTAAILFAGVIGGGTSSSCTGPHPRSTIGMRRQHQFPLGTGTVISLLPGVDGLVTVYDSDTQLILFADTATAATFWAPALEGAAGDPFRAFWDVGTTAAVLVGGPYLVRERRPGAGRDAPGVARGPQGGRAVDCYWAAGDKEYYVERDGYLAPRVALAPVRVPELTGWRYADSLPEIEVGFDDKEWTVADRTENECAGADVNVVLWRGHFNASGAEKSVNLSINGGEAFAASVWLNDVFLNTSYGNSTNNLNVIEETDDRFVFPDGALKLGENVITIVQDNMGLNETDGDNADTSKNPRGVRGFALDNGNFSDWKVQGKVGGYTAYPDKTRGVFNEGGLFGERKGWHLPGFDTSEWETRDLSDGLPGGGAGVGFFVTTFELNIDNFLDVHMSFTFEDPLGPAYRAFLFVNGWMMGKRVANLGPQAKFPVHQGILDYHGENTVAVALWSMESESISPNFRLVVDGVYDSALGEVGTDNPRWSNEGR
ncbi:Glycoside hydrolase family 35 protein [Mycena venus]|uniref:beta-galactosidase n=1 Tax=Mycena venus TaxID=2733690 RepID=A0A8H6X735_9AGAR|nr:Glycoside hydrolase family 35 protein [Mycena venus]